MARILVGGFQHETNTFAPVKATYEAFVRGEGWPPLTRGPDVFTVFKGMNLPIAGAIEEFARLGHAVHPLLWCAWVPSGYVTEDAFERVVGEMLALVKAAPGFDAIYLDLHGAMVVEHCEDGEGELLRRLRALVGPRVPIVASLDLHANTTRTMVENADALAAYRTYPHVDMAETGARAARHLDALVTGKLRPQAKALRKLPFLLPLTTHCTLVEPTGSIYEELGRMEKGAVSLLSFTPGFVQADITDCGPAVIAHAADRDAAEKAADALAGLIVSREREFGDELLPPEEAVSRAMAVRADKPVVIADAQDNPGAGGTSDTTGLLRALVS
ncbi:MAG: M81 family metallopeptidase, partial [Alphaproteobacteria bacterium]|nr:M81 family metallopeptidase [Alphaproteobacteria bacterium]